MDDLIEALTIFRKYANPASPTHCEHDTLWIMGVTEEEIIYTDKKRLDELGFFFSESADNWQSYRFGSA